MPDGRFQPRMPSWQSWNMIGPSLPLPPSLCIHTLPLRGDALMELLAPRPPLNASLALAVFSSASLLSEGVD